MFNFFKSKNKQKVLNNNQYESSNTAINAFEQLKTSSNSDKTINDLGFNLDMSIAKAKNKMLNCKKTSIDSRLSDVLLETQPDFKIILSKVDINNRCINDNSRSLLVFMFYLSTILDTPNKNKVLMNIHLFTTNGCTWGEFVKFSHSFTSLVLLSDDFYNSAQDFILLALRN